MLMQIFYGILNLSFWGYVLAIIILAQITIISVTLYLHRSQTHRALDLHPVLNHFFRFWLWLTTGQITKVWVAIHRKHHARCETSEDPHSPQVMGLRKVLLQGAELYRAEAKNQETLDKYGHGTPDDWIEKNIYTPHSSLGVLIMFILDLILFGVPGITIWALQMITIPFFAAGVVNGIGHYWGYRNFECADAARNVVPWGLILGGEELHNNHHAYATSAKFSSRKWEIDMGWVYIRLFQLFKLAKVKRLPPKLQTVPTKTQIDLDTLKAVVTSRLQVMSHYSRAVIRPVLQEERAKLEEKGRRLWKRAKVLLIRADNLLDEVGRRKIAHILENNPKLQIVYQYRLQLQEIWSRTTANQRELIEALQDWCKRAEATGIKALQNFADGLKQYSLANSNLK